MISESDKFVQENSPDGGFLQSKEWRKFQEAVGRKTFSLSENDFHANVIKHTLPIVGSYFYIPRGPVTNPTSSSPYQGEEVKEGLKKIINLAKKENAGWIRFDAANSRIVDLIRENHKVKKAPHDMQPKEIFVIDIAKSEEQLLAEMKSKTRYNIRLAQKHGVGIIKCEKNELACDQAIDQFVRLIKVTAQRDGITPHFDDYYRWMFETIPEENLKLYIAEYGKKIIAANIVVFFGKTATYLHGASDNNYRNVMAPYLLQWRAILDAKAAGCEKYDFGGIKKEEAGSWSGITRFKTGFSTVTQPLEFSGSYDIVINPFKYNLYKILQRIKALF